MHPGPAVQFVFGTTTQVGVRCRRSPLEATVTQAGARVAALAVAGPGSERAVVRVSGQDARAHPATGAFFFGDSDDVEVWLDNVLQLRIPRPAVRDLEILPP